MSKSKSKPARKGGPASVWIGMEPPRSRGAQAHLRLGPAEAKVTRQEKPRAKA